jgi:hypothetical protein
MPATAAARRVAASPARRSTASRSSLKQRPRKPQPPRARPRSRRGATPITGFVPVVVGRTAGAVGGIADSGVVVRMTRGRIWIGVLGALLVGIVALNVWALGLNASSSKVAQQTDGLKRANSALLAQIAGELSNERVQQAAAKIGLAVPEPGAIRYLEAGGEEAAIAARRLAAGDLILGTMAPETVPAPVVAPEPAATAPVETPPVETAPLEGEPVAVGP